MAAPSPKRKRNKRSPQRKQEPTTQSIKVTAEQLVAVLRQRAQTDQRIADLLTSAQWEAGALNLMQEREELLEKLVDNESEED